MANMHVDEIKALASKAHCDESFRNVLFDAVLGSNRDEAVNAAWTLSHLPLTDIVHINTRRHDLVRIAMSTPDISLRRITLTLLERLDWNSESVDELPEYYVSLLDFCFEHLMMSEEPYGVRSLCMKISYKISRPYPELLRELYQSLLLIEPSDLGAGVRHTRNKILQNIDELIISDSITTVGR